MAIYTGNNGRLYLARRSSTSIKTGASNEITFQLQKGIKVDETLQVITQNGSGRNAVAKQKLTEDSARNTPASIRIINGGTGYAVGDVIYLGKVINGDLKRFTDDFTLTSAQLETTGISDEAALVNGEDFLYGKIQTWQLSSTSEVTDTTALGDVTRSYRPSITSGEGSATLMFYEEDLAETGGRKDVFSYSEILFPRGLAPEVIISLAVDTGIDTADANEVFKTNFVFNAYITGATVSVSYGEIVTIETTFTVDGPLLDIPFKESVQTI